MTAIKAVVKDGRIDLRVPPDWPDGTEVTIRPLSAEGTFGVSEEDEADGPEAVAEWLAWYDSLEPLIFTDAEWEAWEEARRQQREYEKATFPERADKLRRTWE